MWQQFIRTLNKYGIIIDGKVAEWFMALVLKTREWKLRRFESCPFRHILNGMCFLIDIDFGAAGGIDAEVAENNHFVVSDHVGGMKFGASEFV